ncbi:MAG: hypothetical protein EOO66_32335 [Methylobacterium sp.]|nr:MAG: hypothetical protein EOO66_32335 [Methylobacterium sp.]
MVPRAPWCQIRSIPSEWRIWASLKRRAGLPDTTSASIERRPYQPPGIASGLFVSAAASGASIRGRPRNASQRLTT